MLQTQRIRRTVLKIVVGLVAIVAFIYVVGWLSPTVMVAVRETDAKYYPILGACITGAVALAAVTVAGLGLLITYLSQVNPIRTELYKKQSEAVSALYEGISRIIEPLALQVAKGNTDVPEFATRIRKGIVKHRRTRVRYDLYLPKIVIEECGNVTTMLEKVAEWYEKGGRDFSSKDYILGFVEVVKAMLDLHNCCRDIIGTEHLTQGTIRMMGGTLKEQADEIKYLSPEAKDIVDKWKKKQSA